MMEDLVQAMGLEKFGYSQWSFGTFRDHLEGNGGEIYHSLIKVVPDWVQVLFLVNCEAGLELVLQFSAELCLLVLVLWTLVLMHIISSCMDRKKWEVPLLKRMADIDRKLFVTNAEMAILQREVVETAEAGRKEGEMVKALNLQIDTLEQEKLTAKEEVLLKEERSREVVMQLETVKEKVVRSKAEIAERKAKVVELLEVKRVGEEQLREKEEIIQQLDEQLESQKELTRKYEPELDEKVRENQELNKKIVFAQTEFNKIKFNHEKIQKQLIESNLTVEKLALKLADMETKEEDWKSMSDRLQSQLDDRSEASDKLESELSCLRSRILVFEGESESKEKELQIINEALEEEIKRKNGESVEADGWDLDADCIVSVELEEVKEEAKLRLKNRIYVEKSELLEKKVGDLQLQFDKVNQQANEVNSEIDVLREGKKKAVKDQAEAERKLEILTEFFNKKEEELRRKLGLQSSRFENVSSDAEGTARKLAAVTLELELTRSQLNMVKRELEDQEMSLKTAYLEEEKKAQENWIAARQAERKVNEMQKEMGILRNRLTKLVGRKENIVAVIKKEDNEMSCKQVPTALPPLPGLPGLPSLTPLPPLPGLFSLPPFPGMLSAPHDLDMSSMSSYPYQNTSISYASRRTQSMSSISPEQNRCAQGQAKTRSPSSGQYRGRSNRSGYSQGRARSPSPDRFSHDQSRYSQHRTRSPDQYRWRSDQDQYNSASTRISDQDSHNYSHPERYSDQSDYIAPAAGHKYQLPRDWRMEGGEGQREMAASTTDMQGRNWGV